MSVMAVVLGGIAGAQEATAPQAEPPEAVHEETEGPTPGAPTVSLNQAIAMALERNFSLRSAADSVSSARFRESATKARFYPKLTPRFQRSTDKDQTLGLDASQRLPWSGASLTASGTFTTVPGTESPAGHTSTLGLVLTQPLLRGFGPTSTYFDLTNSRRARQNQERAYELSRQRLSEDVARAFYQVVRQRQLLTVSRQSLKRSQDLQQASEARMNVGLASRLDVLRAQLDAAQAQDGMVQAQAGLETALESFRVLLGLSPAEALEPETVKLDERAELVVEPLEVLLERAKASRLELLESRDEVKDAERAFSIARQSLLPQLDLNLGLTQSGLGPTFSDTFKGADRRVTLFLTTSYPLERSNDRAGKAISELQLDASKRSLGQRELEIEGEVRASVRNLERTRKSIELQRQAVEFAEQKRRLATLRYQRGLESNFDVVDAERQLVLARSALVGLLTDYQVARIQLLRVTGTLDVAKEFAP